MSDIKLNIILGVIIVLLAMNIGIMSYLIKLSPKNNIVFVKIDDNGTPTPALSQLSNLFGP